MRLKIIGFFFLLLSFVAFSTIPIFVSPTPANNTDNLIYPILFNISTDDNSILSASFIEIDSVNKSCILATDNLSCAYTLPYSEHIFNHTYSALGYANLSGTLYPTNETRTVPYYGCGYVTAAISILKGNIVSWNMSDCLTINTTIDELDGGGYNVTGGDTPSGDYSGSANISGGSGIIITSTGSVTSQIHDFGIVSGGLDPAHAIFTGRTKGGNGISIQSSSNNIIEADNFVGGNSSVFNGGSGIFINASNNETIYAQNIFGGKGGDGQGAGDGLVFLLSNSSRITVNYSIIGGNHSTSVSGNGIRLTDSYNNTIEAKSIARGSSPGAFSNYAHSITVTQGTPLENVFILTNTTYISINSTNVSFHLYNQSFPSNPTNAVNVNSYLNYSNFTNPQNIYNFKMLYYPLNAPYNENLINTWAYDGSAWNKLSNVGSLDILNDVFDVNMSALNSSGTIGLFNDNPLAYFSSPTPANNTNSTTYPLVFNMSANTVLSPSYIEIDSVNKSCTISADSLSCSYTLPYSEHIFNHTYSALGYANISGTMLTTNETRVVPYYGTAAFNITLNSPASGYSTMFPNAITFNYSTGAYLLNCSLFIDNLYNKSQNTTSGGSFSVSYILVGSHTWFVSCDDGLGNVANSSTKTFSIIPPSSGGVSPSVAPPEVPPIVPPLSVPETTTLADTRSGGASLIGIADKIADASNGAIGELAYTCTPFFKTNFNFIGSEFFDRFNCEIKGLLSLYLKRTLGFVNLTLLILLIVAWMLSKSETKTTQQQRLWNRLAIFGFVVLVLGFDFLFYSLTALVIFAGGKPLT